MALQSSSNSLADYFKSRCFLFFIKDWLLLSTYYRVQCDRFPNLWETKLISVIKLQICFSVIKFSVRMPCLGKNNYKQSTLKGI